MVARRARGVKPEMCMRLGGNMSVTDARNAGTINAIAKAVRGST